MSGRSRALVLTAVGASMLVLSGAGLFLQHEDNHSGFVVLSHRDYRGDATPGPRPTQDSDQLR